MAVAPLPTIHANHHNIHKYETARAVNCVPARTVNLVPAVVRELQLVRHQSLFVVCQGKQRNPSEEEVQEAVCNMHIQGQAKMHSQRFSCCRPASI